MLTEWWTSLEFLHYAPMFYLFQSYRDSSYIQRIVWKNRYQKQKRVYIYTFLFLWKNRYQKPKRLYIYSFLFLVPVFPHNSLCVYIYFCFWYVFFPIVFWFYDTRIIFNIPSYTVTRCRFSNYIIFSPIEVSDVFFSVYNVKCQFHFL